MVKKTINGGFRGNPDTIWYVGIGVLIVVVTASHA